MIAPTCAPGVRRWRGGFRDGGPVPYERTGDWADSPEGGAGMGGCAAHLISQKSKIFDSFSSRRSLGCGAKPGVRWRRGRLFCAASQRPLIRLPIRADTFPSRGRLGALPRQREDLGAGVDGEVTTPQSASLTAPLTRGALVRGGFAGGVVRIGEIMPRGRVAERSESKNNMIAGGNHTIMQR